MKYDINKLLKEYNSGKKMDFVFFWSNKPDPSGKLISTCCSQWWPCTFVVDGVTYNCAEQYMMAEKARLFGCDDIVELILKETNPKKHKDYGRMVRNYDDAIWEQHRYNVVLKGNIAKFSQNEDLKQFLLNTGDKILVEASPYDGIWGIKKRATDNGVKNPNTWNGRNLLGFALMEARDYIKNMQ